MSGRYIPPGRRGKPENGTDEKPPSFDKDESLVSLEDIKAHFWPTKEGELSRLSATPAENKTLHDSAATPGRLAYLVLFHGANPRWEADNIVFTKSNLQLLPAELADDKSKAPSTGGAEEVPVAVPTDGDAERNQEVSQSNSTDIMNCPEQNGGSTEETTKQPSDACSQQTQLGPIAVFKQARRGQQGRTFRFDDWYLIDKLALLEPGSAELIKMLEQKWTKKDKFGNIRQEERSEASWKASLSHRWAVVKLKKDEAAEKELGVPRIERLPDLDPESPKVAKKSVNEMLAELRMGDQKGASD